MQLVAVEHWSPEQKDAHTRAHFAIAYRDLQAHVYATYLLKCSPVVMAHIAPPLPAIDTHALRGPQYAMEIEFDASTVIQGAADRSAPPNPVQAEQQGSINPMQRLVGEVNPQPIG